MADPGGIVQGDIEEGQGSVLWRVMNESKDMGQWRNGSRWMKVAALVGYLNRGQKVCKGTYVYFTVYKMKPNKCY